MKIAKLKRVLKSVGDDKEIVFFNPTTDTYYDVEPRIDIKFQVGGRTAFGTPCVKIYATQNDALANTTAENNFSKIVCLTVKPR